MAGVASRAPGVLVLFGPPGSGKGTQAALLSERLGVPAISTGEMLRRAVDAGTALGGQVASVMSAGMLVDDALMAEVVRERLAQADVADGCILDGYPRNLLQAETLDRLLATQGRAIARVVMIEVPTEELVRRAVGRQRGADDQPEVVRERLGVYVDKTAPVADFYRQRGVLSTIDGSRPVATVTASLLAALGLASAKRG